MHLIKNKKISAGIIVLLTAILLNSCNILKPYTKPDVYSKEASFRDMAAADTANIAGISWRKIYTDPHLVTLIDEALANNTDLKIAEARMKKMMAALGQSRAAFFPSLSANGTATYQKFGEADKSENYQLYGSSSWELDVWGRLRNSKRASLSQYLKSEEYRNAVKTQLIAGVASSYYTLLALDAQLEITEKTIEFRKTTAETIRIMKESDMVTCADLVQSLASLYSAKVSVPDLKKSIYEVENALSTTLGRTAGTIERSTLADQEMVVNLKAGLPAQLLSNRPDVRQAEYQLRYGYEMTNAARKYFYPSLTLRATAGYGATDVSKIFEPSSLFWTLIGGVVQPVFNQGINRARLKSAQADQEEYLATYKVTLLRAGEEVADAMHGYQSASEKLSLRTTQIEYLQKSVDYIMELLKYSSQTTYTDVLLSEINLLNARLGAVNDKLKQMQYVVTLYRSLGGGWRN
jgi:outer membrane protein, multidrug efflux system